VSGFRIVGSETLADAGFLVLREHAVAAPDGETLRRHVVHHPGAVVVVPVEEDRTTVRLLRQYRVAAEGDLLEVPAGKRDVPGEAPETTAGRELHEELGCHPVTLVRLAEFYNSPGFCDEYTHLFVAVGLTDDDGPRAVTAEEAAMTVERVPIASVDELIATRALVDAKSIIGLTLARRYLAGDYAGM